MADRAFRTIALFAGAGMLDEGLRAGLGYLGLAHRTVCYVERETYAAGVLAARMEEGSLDVAPVWSDVTTFDGRRWRGSVDCLVGGFPCQDLSLAGRRAGLDGSRSGLFFEILRIADDCGAQWLFLENVGGIASATAAVVDEAEGELEERACARVLGELADRGWNAEWLTLSAGEVGASHERERWFCFAWRVAYTHGGRSTRLCWSRQSGIAEHSHGLADARIQGLSVTERKELRGEGGREKGGTAPELCGPLFAPGPADPRWPAILAFDPGLAPALEPGFCGVVDGLATELDRDRAARLRIGGNGVVAAQAGCAFVVLARRSGAMTVMAENTQEAA